MSGQELQQERVARLVSQTQLAQLMGVTKQRISYIEKRPVVTPLAAARYMAALFEFPVRYRALPRAA